MQRREVAKKAKIIDVMKNDLVICLIMASQYM